MSSNIPPQGPPPQGPPSGGQYPPQGPPGGYPPQGYYQQPPPKKSHALRNTLLGVLFAFILLMGGCFALLGGAANEVDKAIEETADGSDSGLSEEEANDSPTVVKVGKAFTHDGFKANGGWRVTKEEFTNAPKIVNLRVTNTTQDDQRTALFTFSFYKGSEVLAEVECTTNEMQAGEASRMQCFSTAEGFPQGYDSIKVADAF